MFRLFSLSPATGLLMLCIAVIATKPLPAQQLTTAQLSTKAGETLDISADGGLQWDHVHKTFTATGNVVLKHTDKTIQSDKLIVSYGTSDGRNQLHHIEAEGDTTLHTPSLQLSTQRIIYDLNNNILKAQGNETRLQSMDTTLNVNGQIEYRLDKQIITATGNAVITAPQAILKANIVELIFETSGTQKNLSLHQVNARENLRMEMSEQTISGARGSYNLTSGQGMILDNVVAQQGASSLSGCKFIFNTRTGISSMSSCAVLNITTEEATGKPMQESVSPSKRRLEGSFTPKAR